MNVRASKQMIILSLEAVIIMKSMDLTRQNERAQAMNYTFLALGEKTCIDCHKGIAHQLPDMIRVEG